MDDMPKACNKFFGENMIVGTDMKKYFGVKSKVAIQINGYCAKTPQ